MIGQEGLHSPARLLRYSMVYDYTLMLWWYMFPLPCREIIVESEFASSVSSGTLCASATCCSQDNHRLVYFKPKCRIRRVCSDRHPARLYRWTRWCRDGERRTLVKAQDPRSLTTRRVNVKKHSLSVVVGKNRQRLGKYLWPRTFKEVRASECAL